MEIVGKFEKVSFDQFKKEFEKFNVLTRTYPTIGNTEVDEDIVRQIYDSIKLPKRGTSRSAGYDFFAPCKFVIDTAIVIPTGIKCKIKDGWFLDINPRSGQGFKYGIRLANTRGIIDSDYYDNLDNEGHIMIKMVYDKIINDTQLEIEDGKAFAQGIFSQYGITEDDDATETRGGGFGSTDTSNKNSTTNFLKWEVNMNKKDLVDQENKIYTYIESSNIVDMFEKILYENNISIPSPEDNFRDNDLGLYGSVYYKLFHDVEGYVKTLINRVKDNPSIEVVSGGLKCNKEVE